MTTANQVNYDIILDIRHIRTLLKSEIQSCYGQTPVDKLQINHDYQQHMEKHQLSFEDWMERSNLNKLINMGDEPYEIDDPWILKTLTEIGHRDFFVANWLMDYMSTKLNFDMTAGVILWPIVFILTDLINEYYGKKGVQKLSWIAAALLVYAFIAVRFAMWLQGAEVHPPGERDQRAQRQYHRHRLHAPQQINLRR